jgi:hypothetical protein
MNILELFPVPEAIFIKIKNSSEFTGGIILKVDKTKRSARILESDDYVDALDKTIYLHLKNSALKAISKRHDLIPNKVFNLYIIKQINKAPKLIAHIEEARIITPKNRTYILFNICKNCNSKTLLNNKKQKNASVGLLPNIKFRRRHFKWLNQTI